MKQGPVSFQKALQGLLENAYCPRYNLSHERQEALEQLLIRRRRCWIFGIMSIEQQQASALL